MRNISNSEVTAFLRCKQQYEWAYVQNLAPNVEADALTRGTLGHEAFQRYSEARIDGHGHDQAMKYADDVFMKAMSRYPTRMDLILQTKMLFMNYMNFHKGWPTLKIISVEQRHDLPLNENLTMSLRYDTMVEDIASGKRLIGDYKFTYDFWTPDEHALNGQMPKYIFVMNANGFGIDGGFLEEIRTRKLSKENMHNPKMAWKRTMYFPSVKKQKNMMRQHIAASLEIDTFRNLPDDEREARTIPVLDKYGACKFCNFKEACASKLDGGDPQVILDTAFQQNTYGYNHEEEEIAL